MHFLTLHLIYINRCPFPTYNRLLSSVIIKLESDIGKWLWMGENGNEMKRNQTLELFKKLNGETEAEDKTGIEEAVKRK